MLAYTVKLDVKTCHLLYPPSMDTDNTLGGYYEIKHQSGEGYSRVYYHRLPTMILNPEDDLKELINKQEEKLKIELLNIICNDTTKKI